MTEILLHSSPSSISSTPSSAPSNLHRDDDDPDPFFSLTDAAPGGAEKPISISRVTRPPDDDDAAGEKGRDDGGGDQLSFLALLVTIFRKPFTVACKAGIEDLSGMDIGFPTNVRHVAHVTFDRFNGFLGLPVEFEPDVPRRAPSASATVFGVSTDSMQLSFDSRGNSVPTILLHMQRCLYARGGLEAEGIFRIAAGNSQEEYVRDQLNRGVVPEDIDVHCLAGLIKAWFRELPTGVLDSLSSEQVMQCKSEEDYAAVMRHLPPADAALLDWSVNLMADIVQQECVNKMNAHNIAVVFAPNMTQVSDPETALNHTVKVMNFLSSLINKTLRERERSLVVSAPTSQLEPSHEKGVPSSSSLPCPKDTSQQNQEMKPTFTSKEPVRESYKPNNEPINRTGGEAHNGSTPGPGLDGRLASEAEKRKTSSEKKLPSSQSNRTGGEAHNGSTPSSGLDGRLANETEKRAAHSSKASSQEKLPGSLPTFTNCRNGPEIGKNRGVKLTGEAEADFGDQSLYCLNTMSARIVEAWR